MNNPATRLVVDLTGVGNPWSAAHKAVVGASGAAVNGAPWGGSTDWELLQILNNPSWWNRITFWENGANVPNPFHL